MRTKERRNGPTYIFWYTATAVLITSIAARPAAAVEVAAGDWKLTASGNVNVYYINSSCEEQTTLGITGGLACRGAAGHDVPDLVLQLGELERLGHLLGLHCCRARMC